MMEKHSNFDRHALVRPPRTVTTLGPEREETGVLAAAGETRGVDRLVEA